MDAFNKTFKMVSPMKWLLFIFGAVLTVIGLQQQYDENNIDALTKNCYYEARNSTIEDQIATAVVVMNRGIPHIEVFKDKQFSWTSNKHEEKNDIHYKRCRAIATMVYWNHELFTSNHICLHYTSADAVFKEGHWTKSFKTVTRIGKHNYWCR